MIPLLLLACKAPAPVMAEPEPAAEVRDVLYFVLVDRFANGSADAEPVDPSDPQAWHGGDLQGVIDHLDDLDDLGVAGLWLSPITEARTDKIDEWGAFHGYWVSDLGAIEPRLGTMDQARELRSQLDERGMSLWLDMVYNHVGYDTPLVTEKPGWFHGNGDVQNWDDPVQVVTHDVHGLPDLAQENEEVYAHLLEASKVWVEEVGPDGFRIDAVRHMPEGFLKRLGGDLRAIDPDFQLLGEVFEGNAAALARRQKADQLDRVFDFPLHYAMKDSFCGGKPSGRIASTLSLDSAEGRVTFLDNHDVSRLFSACDRQSGIAALAFLLASRGTPCLTYGTEAGLTGAEEPANRADMAFGADPELRETLKDLIAIRARWPSLRDGVTRFDRADDVLIMLRTNPNEQTLVIWNDSDSPIDAPSGDESWGVVDGSVPPGAVALVRSSGTFSTTAKPVSARVTATADLEEGDRLVLVGAGEALGNWNPGAGIPEEDGGFTLSGTEGSVLAYKLVIRKSDGSEIWEDRPDRYLRLPSGGRVHTFGE